MTQDVDKILPYQLIKQTVGIDIKIMSNEYKELPGYEGEGSSYQKIIFQVKEDDPDIFAIGILFCLSLLSFTFAAPRGYSEKEFVPDEEYSLGYFLQDLEFGKGQLRYHGDYVSGRLIKTEIVYESGGKVALTAINRGKSADRWMLNLQGKGHIKPVKK